MKTQFEVAPPVDPEFGERPQELESQTLMPEQRGPTQEEVEVLGTLSITELARQSEIDEETVAQFVRRSRREVDRALWKAETNARFTPAVASAIAHHAEPSVEQIYPTAAEIKEQKWYARWTSGFLGMFSSRWAGRFDNYLESKAKKKITTVTNRTVATVDSIGSVARPKEQFVQELSSLYHQASQNPSQREGLLHALEHIGPTRPEADVDKEGESSSHSILFSIMHLSKFTSRVDRMSIRAGTPEIMQGIERFLKRHNVLLDEALQTTEKPTLARRITQRLKPQKLAMLPEQIEATLAAVYNILPADGRHFKEGIYAICKNITFRAQQGETGQNLTGKLIKEIQHFIQGK